MYLRHDFEHRCAYCGALEEALSPLPEVGDRLFEKDHFLPQSSDNPSLNEYPNLFYSCGKCNGKKSNVLLTLNPCEDDIYSGQNPKIKGGTSKEKYIVTGTTPKGVQFVTDLELNSRYHRRLRKNQYLWLLAKQEGYALLRDPRYTQKLSSDDLKKIKRILNQGIDLDEYESVCGGSEHAQDVVEACQLLEERGYAPKVILDENGMDIEATINGKTYCGSIRIEDSITTYRKMTTQMLAEQRKVNKPIALFVYVPNQSTICFYEVDFQKVNWKLTEHRLTNCVQL